MRTLIIGDIHGQIDTFEGILLKTGIINDKGVRVDYQTQVIHVGDLIDGGRHPTGDFACLNRARKWMDKLVVGNHEWAFLSGVSFAGQRNDHSLIRGLVGMKRDGFLVPSALVGDVLITHAGVGADWDWKTAKEAHETISELWLVTDGRDPIFQAVGAQRGGSDSCGGIFWADITEEKNTNFHQVFGHTPWPTGPLAIPNENGVKIVDVDIGAKKTAACAAILIEDGVEDWGVFTYERPDKQAELEKAFNMLTDTDVEREWEEIPALD